MTVKFLKIQYYLFKKFKYSDKLTWNIITQALRDLLTENESRVLENVSK